MIRLLSLAGCAIILTAGPAHAQTVYVADLSGANETGPVSTPGSGGALVVFDPSFTTMTVQTTFSDLLTPTVDGHIHCCAPPGEAAGAAVLFADSGFPLGVTAGQYSASYDLGSAATFSSGFTTDSGGSAAEARVALIEGMRNGLSYVNIHTEGKRGGELRANLMTGPELTPQAYSLLPEVALQTSEFQDSTVRRYLHDVRSAETTPISGDGKAGMFLTTGARSGQFEGGANRPEVDIESAGVMGGLDYRFGARTLVGVMGGYDSSDARLSPTSRESKVKGWFTGVYSSVALGPAHLDLQASYGKSNYDLFRSISVGTFHAESVAETESKRFMLQGTAALKMQGTRFDAEPYAGLRYVKLHFDGFTETGNIAALAVDAADVESVQSIAGFRMGADIPMGGTLSIRPAIKAEWRHEFKSDEPRLITGTYGGGVAPFTFTTMPLADNYLVVGAGFSVSMGSRISFAVDYSGQLRGGYDIHALAGSMRVAF